jgi:hypothetical protein
MTTSAAPDCDAGIALCVNALGRDSGEDAARRQSDGIAAVLSNRLGNRRDLIELKDTGQ